MKRFKLDTIAKLGIKKILVDFGNYISDFVNFVSGASFIAAIITTVFIAIQPFRKIAFVHI
jgi:hypothetical protein